MPKLSGPSGKSLTFARFSISEKKRTTCNVGKKIFANFLCLYGAQECLGYTGGWRNIFANTNTRQTQKPRILLQRMHHPTFRN